MGRCWGPQDFPLGAPGGGSGGAPTAPATLLATSAQAAAQTTALGKELHRLASFGGGIVGFYGDFITDTGPIDAIFFDPANPTAGFVSEATLHTEETWQGLVAGGKLYVPYLDPQGFEDPTTGQLAIATAPGSWTVVTTVMPVPIHTGGVGVLGTDIFLSGAANDSGGGATVWRSTDAGATWTEVLAPRPDTSGGTARFHAPVVIADTVQVFNSWDGHLHEWEGATWTDYGQVAPLHDVSDWVPFTFNGTPFALCLEHGKDDGAVTDSTLYSRTRTVDDAQRAVIDAALPVSMARDICTDGTYLYVLVADGTIWRGDTTGAWTALVQATGVAPTCFAVIGGLAYLGTTDSKLWSVPLP